MNQQADSAMRNHRVRMRTFVFISALAVLTTGGAGLASVASAQSNPTPRPETPAPRPDTQGRVVPEAPVGHRQPARRTCRPAYGVRKAPGPRTKRPWTRSWKSVAGVESGGLLQLKLRYRLRRYSVGVRPACLRNAVANELASPKPRSSPICVTGRAGVANRFLAFSMRRLTR